MGVVYEAIEESLNRRVALKVLPGNVSLGASAIERFHREAEIVGRLVHPGIIKLFRVGEVLGNHFFAMEFVDGESLQQFLDRTRHDAGDPRISKILTKEYIDRAVGWTIAAAEALHSAHEAGVIHRDVKPANILLSRDGRIVLTDFGLAREEVANTLTVTGEFMGTPVYMSPEQVLASRVKVDRRSDVYSLGVTLYECLSLQTPFKGDSIAEILQQISFKEAPNPRTLNPRVPKDLATIVLKAIEKDPDRRYATAQAFATDLGAFLRHEPVRARPIGPARRVVRAVRRYPRIASAAAGAVILLGGGVLAIWTYLAGGRFIGSVRAMATGEELTLMKGRSGWNFLGFPRAETPYGLVLEDVRADARASIQKGVAIRRGEEPAEILLPLLEPMAKVRVLDLLGRREECRKTLLDALQGSAQGSPASYLIQWADLLGNIAIGDLQVEQHLARWEKEGRPSTRAPTDIPVDATKSGADAALQEWLSHQSEHDVDRFIEGLTHANPVGAVSPVTEDFLIRFFQSDISPATPESDTHCRLLEDTCGDERPLGVWAGISTVHRSLGCGRLLRHLNPTVRARLLDRRMRGGESNDRVLTIRAIDWVENPESKARIVRVLAPLIGGEHIVEFHAGPGFSMAQRFEPFLLSGASTSIANRLLRQFLVSGSAADRASAVIALSRRVGPAEAESVFAPLLTDPYPDVADAAAAALYRATGDDNARARIQRTLVDSAQAIRARWIAAMALLSTNEPLAPEAVKFFFAHVDSSEVPGSNGWLARSIGGLVSRSPGIRRLVETYSTAPEKGPRYLAWLALAYAGDRSHMIELLGAWSDYPSAAEAISDFLALVGDERSLTTIRAQLASASGPERESLDRFVCAILRNLPRQKLDSMLNDPDSDLRFWTVVELSCRASIDGANAGTKLEGTLRGLSRTSLLAREAALRLRHRETLDHAAHQAIENAMSQDHGGFGETAVAEINRATAVGSLAYHRPESDVEIAFPTAKVIPRGWDCPAAPLASAIVHLRRSEIGYALWNLDSLLQSDPRWAPVLQVHRDLEPLRNDRRFQRMIEEALQITTCLGLTQDPEADWSPAGLRRHGIDLNGFPPRK